MFIHFQKTVAIFPCHVDCAPQPLPRFGEGVNSTTGSLAGYNKLSKMCTSVYVCVQMCVVCRWRPLVSLNAWFKRASYRRTFFFKVNAKRSPTAKKLEWTINMHYHKYSIRIVFDILKYCLWINVPQLPSVLVANFLFNLSNFIFFCHIYFKYWFSTFLFCLFMDFVVTLQIISLLQGLWQILKLLIYVDQGFLQKKYGIIDSCNRELHLIRAKQFCIPFVV